MNFTNDISDYTHLPTVDGLKEAVGEMVSLKDLRYPVAIHASPSFYRKLTENSKLTRDIVGPFAVAIHVREELAHGTYLIAYSDGTINFKRVSDA